MGWDDTLLSRVEDAGLNASAPPEQRWMDGWWLRFSPGKAKRARCVNAVAPGRTSLPEHLAAARQLYAEAGLPLLVRITPFSRPDTLDAQLSALGLGTLDDTRVMVCETLVSLDEARPAAMFHVEHWPLDVFAETVGLLRGSSAAQREAHRRRLAFSPVPYQAFVLKRGDEALACGQTAREGPLVGLYDVFTAPEHRGKGYAQTLCRELLHRSRAQGATVAYLQVEGDNISARTVYTRLGFKDAYRYHYRTDDVSAG